GWRFADGVIDAHRQLWIGVREDHGAAAAQSTNTIVSIDLRKPGVDAGRVVADGHDFFSSPRLSSDGKFLAWLAWDHPNMPWNGTTLYLGRLDDDGRLAGDRKSTRLNSSHVKISY